MLEWVFRIFSLLCGFSANAHLTADNGAAERKTSIALPIQLLTFERAQLRSPRLGLKLSKSICFFKRKVFENFIVIVQNQMVGLQDVIAAMQI